MAKIAKKRVAKKKPARISWRKYTVAVLPWFLVLLLALSVILTSAYANNQSNRAEQAKAFIDLALQQSSLVPGRACGILSRSVAKAYIGDGAKRSLTNIAAPTVLGEVVALWHFDSCRYVAVDDSNKYVQLFITSYPDSQTAEEQYNIHLPIVADLVDLDAEQYGAEELKYDAGVVYLLRNKQIVAVSAGNGSPADAERFVRQIFNDLIVAID